MKKRLALIGACVMGLSLLAGCGSTSKIPDYSKYVTLGNYEGLEFVPEDTTVTDDQVQSKIDSFLEENKISTEITDRPSKEGDKINIDYVGTVDGVEFEGGSTKGQGTDVTVGSSGYIDNFDEQLVGMKVGDTKNINVTFPEDYGKKELNGKAAVFVTTLNKITEETTPELTDELVAEKTECKTVDEYKKKVRDDLQKEADDNAEESKKDQLIEAAAKTSTYSAYPEDEIKKLVDDAINNAKTQASQYGITDFNQYISLFFGASSEDEFEKKISEDAKTYMEQKMTVCAIARKEKLSASDEDIKAYIDELLERYPNASEEDVHKAYTDEQLAYFAIEEKVGELLAKTAVEGEATTEETSEEDASEAETEAEGASEDASEAETTEAASEDASEAETTEAASEDASEAETTEAASEDASTEAETAESASEDASTTEAASTEAE